MIIGITGYKGSGKDTVACILQNQIGGSIHSFADPLKDGIRELFNFTAEQMYSSEKDKVDPRYGFTPRAMLQFFGTEVMQYNVPNAFPCFERSRGRSHWVKLLFENLDPDAENVIIPDVRFLHEAKAIREEGGKIILVDRGILNFDMHPSEIEVKMIPVNATIDNTGNLIDLKDKVLRWLWTLEY